MKKYSVKYYFGRFNLLPIMSDGKERFIFEGLNQSISIMSYDFFYGFVEIENVSFENENFISGYLVKFASKKEEEVAVIETQSIEHEEIQNPVIAKSRFFLHVKSSIIAFHIVPGKISEKQFKEIFCMLFEKSKDNFFIKAEIQMIQEDISIFEMFRKFQTISEVSIYLHPSNPSSRDIWKSVDDRLRKMDARSYNEKYQFNPGLKSQNIINDEDINSKIIMASDGYGSAIITGRIDGKERTVSTNDNPITYSAPNDSTSTISVLDKLKIQFQNLWKRYTK